jgi:hypothetical protein
MSEQDIKFIIGVLAHFVMEVDSITSKRRAIEIINKLGKELRHD